MKTLVTLFVLTVLAYGGLAEAQDLPDDVLADMYLLEATEALEKGDAQAAIRAFAKIEALDTQPPLEFLYFYGKLLVESSSTFDNMLKGQSLLKQYVLNIDKGSEHYTPTLKLLSMARGKLEELDPKRRAEKARQQLADLEKQMVRVDGGSFVMGCQDGRDRHCYDREKPAHRVQVRSFEIGKYEVTQELWEAVMGENPSNFKGCARCPVEEVSWDDVQAFLRKLNAQTGLTYRLPTEAEWEYAARGGRQSRGYRYAGSNDPGSVAWYWYEDNSGEKTHPVGQKQPNELGLYDMSGNVDEWTQDCWNNSYAGAPGDGRAWERGDCGDRVVRGGSWFDVPGGNLRAANRYPLTTGFRVNHLGFRITRTLAL